MCVCSSEAIVRPTEAFKLYIYIWKKHKSPDQRGGDNAPFKLGLIHKDKDLK